MVQLTLPKNSKIVPGKTWPAPAGAKRTTEFRVYRWNPDDGQTPHIDTYFVDRDDCGLHTHINIESSPKSFRGYDEKF